MAADPSSERNSDTSWGGLAQEFSRTFVLIRDVFDTALPGYVAGPFFETTRQATRSALLGNCNGDSHRFGARAQSLVLDTLGHAKRE
jgi:hypothetical protein